MVTREAILVAFALRARALFALRVEQQSDHFLSAFQSYVHSFEKTYASAQEYRMRMELFAQRKLQVEAHNQNADRNWQAGFNHLSDRTEAELNELQGWAGIRMQAKKASKSAAQEVYDEPLPTHFDWSRLQASKSVKDQLRCGSCWAFATATILQAHSEIFYPRVQRRTFSAEDLVDCVPNPLQCGGKGGCEGSSPPMALDWVSKKAVSTVKAAPYVAGRKGNASKCKKFGGLGSEEARVQMQRSQAELYAEMQEIFAPGVKQVAKDSPARSFGMIAWERLPINRYEPLLHAVVERGPVAVSVDASAWMNYESGIFDNCTKDAVLVHSTVLLGFGVQEARRKHVTLKYWLIQNSWGNRWGEHGKIRLIRHEDEGQWCGTDVHPELGSGCKGGPKEIEVCGSCGVLYESVVPHFISS